MTLSVLKHDLDFCRGHRNVAHSAKSWNVEQLWSCKIFSIDYPSFSVLEYQALSISSKNMNNTLSTAGIELLTT